MEGKNTKEYYRYRSMLDTTPKTWKGVLVRFAEYTSLQGIPFIYRSKYTWAKLAWSFFLVVAMVCTVGHYYIVAKKYMHNGITTRVKVTYADLPFPSVTICNINPVRESAVTADIGDLYRFLEEIKPPDRPQTSGYRGPPQNSNGQGGRCSPQTRRGDFREFEGGGGGPGSFIGRNPHGGPQQGGLHPGGPQHGGPRPVPPPFVQRGGGPPPQRGFPPGGPLRRGGPGPQHNNNRGSNNNGQPGQHNWPQGNRGPGSRQGGPGFQQGGPGSQNGGLQGGGSWRNSGSGSNAWQNMFNQRGCRPTPPSVGDFNQVNLTAFSKDYLGQATIPENLDRSFAINAIFRRMLGELDNNVRFSIGHQMESTILDCSYGSQKCGYEDFEEWLSPDYGNCFTFHSHLNPNNTEKDFMSSRSGAKSGLKLILYIQRHEYLKSLTTGYGVRVDVHPFGTMPFMSETGMSVPPGTETFFGLKLITSRRIADYEPCETGEDFEELYGMKYTTEACINMCEERNIAEICLCYLPENVQNSVHAGYSERYPACTLTDHTCEKEVRVNITTKEIDCKCDPSCKTVEYDVISSNNHWPSNNLWPNLVDAVCSYRDETACQQFHNVYDNSEEEKELKQNFLALKIYYRDLNYQSIQEMKEYETSQFVADVGGVAGLWIGASLLSYIELVDFLFHIVAFACKKQKPSKSQPRETSNGKAKEKEFNLSNGNVFFT